MKHKVPYGFLLLTIAFLFILHVMGIYLQFYWRVSGYDRVVHIIGAFWTTFVVLFALTSTYSFKKSTFFILGIIISLIIGIGWEVFEVIVGFTNPQDIGFQYDTIADIVSDFVGGLIAGGYVLLKYVSTNNTLKSDLN